jgi:hypothetical protein
MVAAPDATVAATVERGARLAAVGIAFGWHLAVNLPAIVAAWPDLRWPWAALGGWLLYVLVGVLASVRIYRRLPVPTVPLLAVLLLVDVLTFAIVPAAETFHAANWAWGTIGWFAVLVLWGGRVTTLVAVMVANAAIAFVAVLLYSGDLAVDLSRFVMFVYGTAVLPIALLAATDALQVTAQASAASAAARAVVEAERAGAARAQQDRRERLAIVTRAAGAVLADLARGRADPADPDVQRRAALAAARLRRLIAESDDVPDPLLHELRACVDVAERQGVAVDLVAVGQVPPLPVPVRRLLAEPLAAVLAGARGWARLTVVANDDEVVVSLTTPDADVPDGRSSWVVDGVVDYWYERDEDLVWTQTRWRAA